MIYALDKNNNKILPYKGGKAKCSFCKCQVIACVGEIKRDYWRHAQNILPNCVANHYENETLWHANFKFLFDKEFVEVYCKSNKGVRIADVKLENGLVIEFQHSSISTKEIRKREQFHENMIWLFDASGAKEAGRLRYKKKEYFWEYPRLSIMYCKAPVFLDMGYGNIWEVFDMKIETTSKKKDWETWNRKICKGRGRLYTREEFKEKMIKFDKVITKLIPFKFKTFKEKCWNLNVNDEFKLEIVPNHKKHNTQMSFFNSTQKTQTKKTWH